MDPETATSIEALIPNLRRCALVLVRDPRLAEDTVLDCLERAVSRYDLLTPGTDLRAWLFAILTGRVRAAVRRRRSRRDRNAPEERGDLSAGPAIRGGSPRMPDLQQAFDKLAGPSREVIVLVILEGMAYEQAAEVTGMPVDTIRARLSRAREKLQRQINGEPMARSRQQGRPHRGAVAAAG